MPVLSWLALRGKCRGCGERIGAIYPAVELLTALLIVACFFCSAGRAPRSSPASSARDVTVSATDLSHRIVPNVVVLPATLVVLVAMTALHPSPEWILGASAPPSSSSSPPSPTRRGMGDVKLALLLGAMLGRTVPVALMVGMLAALVPSIVRSCATAPLGRWGSRLRHSSRSAASSPFYGDQLLDAYLSLM